MGTQPGELRENMITEYRLILEKDDGTRKPKKLSSIYFKGPKAQAHEEACALFRFFFEEVAHFTPNDAFSLLSPAMINTYHLRIPLKHIIFPNMINAETGLFYVAVACYPEVFKHFSVRQMIIMEYNQLRSENKSLKLPFTKEGGKEKAACFLNLAYHQSDGLMDEFKNLEDMYLFFASKKGKKYIKECNLDKACELHFGSPLIFFHESLSNAYSENVEEKRSGFNFMYADFMTKTGQNKFDKKSKKKEKDK